MDLENMLKRIEGRMDGRLRPYDSDLHGIGHLREVALLAGRIAEELGEDVEGAMVAGLLHDCGRVDDVGGSQHARDSAALARPILKECFPRLDAERIIDAIARHADGLVTKDPLAGALWDADRLRLERLGHEVDLELLSTAPGKARAARRRENLNS